MTEWTAQAVKYADRDALPAMDTSIRSLRSSDQTVLVNGDFDGAETVARESPVAIASQAARAPMWLSPLGVTDHRTRSGRGPAREITL